MQLQVTNSPFTQEQVELLNRLLPNLSDAQRSWLSGYLTAVQSTSFSAPSATNVASQSTAQAATQAPIAREVTILFGSQTGNSQRLAKSLSKKLSEQGLEVTLTSMSDFKPNTLKKVQDLLLLVSTHGEGDPPDNALPFYEFLHSKRAPKLDELRFSVLALGDSSYEFFCKTGKDFDQRLEELGAKRLTDRVDCDVDYDEPAAEWFASVSGALSNASSTAPTQSSVATISDAQGESQYSRTHPFQAEVLENINLNGRGSSRETRHLELSLEGSNLQYEPGDCLGIYPENNPQLVDQLVSALGWNADEQVSVNKQGEQRALRDALRNNFEITVLTKPVLEQAVKLTANEGLSKLLAAGNEAELKAYIKERDLLDLVQDFGPWNATAAQFVSILRKLPARLYSIASSNQANPDEVHLTIRAVRYETLGRDRFGVCSTQVAERLEIGDTLPVYIHQNPNFKLPANPDAPIIMIGPGTGVAPFRAFVEERAELGATGKSWLFYGDQHFLTDFLYQTDWQRWIKEGALTKMDVAFSRDTDQKVYVQHRMLEKGRELFEWLEEGASVYICGDEKHMAHDVHAALLTIIEREGGKSSEEAAAYLANLQQQKRYQRDVY
ncbi:MAG: assimilatory sulfite reductase (NADPH) flavoprotein subunit [Candidatus Cohnella colombiensis]|uniref:assimilatory sulfite reductase (NADPH) n=1 Tax=Candidatus Cohnella colombiensis TaxID=3121368 RepID=A0AA95JGQ8_9BACL|nr:MAG: assimilatory sulfite reductase (NADPH) flavoprotein subunit [Cohnella sp.]